MLEKVQLLIREDGKKYWLYVNLYTENKDTFVKVWEGDTQPTLEQFARCLDLPYDTIGINEKVKELPYNFQDIDEEVML